MAVPGNCCLLPAAAVLLAWGGVGVAQEKPADDPYRTVVRPRDEPPQPVEQVLGKDEFRRMPGGQDDALKAVQNLPGVARPPFGLGQIIVWGMAPTDTRVYADGVAIPRVYHFGGLRSTINAEFIQDLTFRPGGYSADYGRGLGGVVDLSTRDPRKDGLHGSVALDLIDGSLTLEGSITKKLQVLAGARVSWIGGLLPVFTQGDPQLVPFYWDYQVKARYEAGPHDDLRLFAFGSGSDVTAQVSDADPDLQVNIKSHSYFSRLLLRWTHRFSPQTTLVVTPSVGSDVFTLDTGQNGIGGQHEGERTQQFSYNLRAEVRHRPLPWLEGSAGVDFEGARADVDVVAPGGPPLGLGDTMGVPAGSGDTIRDAAEAEGSSLGARLFAGTGGPAVHTTGVEHVVQAAPYAMLRMDLLDRHLQIMPQLRLEVASLHPEGTGVSNVQAALEPRLLVVASAVPGRLAFKAAIGRYHQAPLVDELLPGLGNPALALQSGTAYVLGAEVTPVRTLHIEAQGFYKDLRDLVVPAVSPYYTNDGLGRVYGGEVLVRQELFHNFFGWIAYTLSRSERRDGPGLPWYLFRYDQTHLLTVLASYRLPWRLQVGVRFRYATGNPTAPLAAAPRQLDCQCYVPVLGPAGGTRLPDFHQLDVRIDKTFAFRRWRLGVYLDVQNVYNRRNAEYLAWSGRQLYQTTTVGGLPIFPDLGVRADF